MRTTASISIYISGFRTSVALLYEGFAWSTAGLRAARCR